MNRWYQWFYVSLGFALGGILNCFAGKGSFAAFLPAVGTALLAMIQFFCDKKGESGKRIYRYICTGVIVVLAVSLICLLLRGK